MLRARIAPIALAFAATVAACGGGSAGEETARPEGPGYPTEMAAPSSIPGAWAIEQEVTIAHAEGESSFRAVLQKRGDELMLVGLAPHGARAFILTQRGDDVSFEKMVPLSLPFPPEYMLHDVHRMWLQPANPPEGGSGEVDVTRDGEKVVELWRDGALVSRTFTRLDDQPTGAIVATYPDGLAVDAPASASPPDEAHFDNGWFGYRATIRTLSWTPIPE